MDRGRTTQAIVAAVRWSAGEGLLVDLDVQLGDDPAVVTTELVVGCAACPPLAVGRQLAVEVAEHDGRLVFGCALHGAALSR